jgi:hypothetical protein
MMISHCSKLSLLNILERVDWRTYHESQFEAAAKLYLVEMSAWMVQSASDMDLLQLTRSPQ